MKYTTSPIKKSIINFFGYNEGDTEANTLYYLRNCITHDASLLHYDKILYIFRYDRHTEKLIESPKKHWDGDINNLEQNHITIINPDIFYKKVETTIRTIRENFENEKK